jgi:hypothetical protein
MPKAVAPIARDILFTVTTPCADATEVVCYKDTMENHIIPNHGEVSHDLIVNTLNSPDVVYMGSSNPDHLAFINYNELSPSGSPFAVFVNPSTKPKPLVVSACHRREYKQTKEKEPKEQRIVWSPPK